MTVLAASLQNWRDVLAERDLLIAPVSRPLAGHQGGRREQRRDYRGPNDGYDRPPPMLGSHAVLLL
jgi:hypothetical protein